MADQWLEELRETARHLVFSSQHEIAQDLTEHERGCPVFVTAECLLAVAGYTPTAFMVAWGTNKIPAC